MNTAYVLMETDEPHAIVIGVFASPDISDEKLREYYGESMKVKYTEDVRDSGLEWQKQIITSGRDAVTISLHYFNVGEI